MYMYPDILHPATNMRFNQHAHTHVQAICNGEDTHCTKWRVLPSQVEYIGKGVGLISLMSIEDHAGFVV